MAIIWRSKEADKATGGKSTSVWSATGVSIDTRTLKKGDLFIALSGENHDGHDYVEQAFAKGATAAMVTRVPPKGKKSHKFIIVKDTMDGLEKLAVFRRKQVRAKIIGITGSVGKTSVKEGTNVVLRDFGKTHCSIGNFNNHIGLPLSMARMPKDTDYGIFEMGMSGKGEIHHLSTLLQPDISLITNVQGMHLEFFKSIEDIAHAKAEIFDGTKKSGVAILPADNPYYKILLNKAKKKGIRNILSFGRGNKSNYLLNKENNTTRGQLLVVGVKGKEIGYEISILGAHQALNSVAILAVVSAAGVDIKKAAKSLKKFAAAKGRGKIEKIKYKGKEFILIDDSYNAGPDSMKAAFKVLSTLKSKTGKRTIALLGDMLELGKDSRVFHKKLANDVEGIDSVFTAGKLMKNLHDALPDNKKMGHYKKPEDILPKFQKYVKTGDIVLVKGSNGSQMWKLVDIMTGK